MMILNKGSIALVAAFVLAACATPSATDNKAAPAQSAPSSSNSASAQNAGQSAAAQTTTLTANENGQMDYDKSLASGGYACELGAKIQVFRNDPKPGQLMIHWKNQRTVMDRQAESNSGLPRYENKQAGLTWIDLPSKSMLLDQRSGRPLLSECVALNDNAKNEPAPAEATPAKANTKTKAKKGTSKSTAKKK